MGCCDGKKDIAGKGVRAVNPTELIQYIGPRQHPFIVVGGVTRVQYFVDGPGELVKVYKTGEVGVALADRRWFLAVDRGNAYQEYVEPEPEPELIPIADPDTWTDVAIEDEE